MIVAAASFMNSFASYDEDGNIVWVPDSEFTIFNELYVRWTNYFDCSGSNISAPYCETSMLELVSPDRWITMDGYVLSTTNQMWMCI